MLKKTKIICTMGPSTENPEILRAMIEGGMNVARFNFSHGNHEEHLGRIELVRRLSAETGKTIALLLDTKGPEMRLGKFVEGKVQLTEGQTFILTSEEIAGTAERASVNHPLLPQEVVAGNVILLADGLIELVVEEVRGNDIITTVQNTGVIGDRKRVAAPGVSLNLPFLSEKDIADIEFGMAQGMDFIAASFVQRAADILAIRKVLEQNNTQMDIIAKIENAEGVKNIDEIIKVADGIMVARGDLGVEIPSEEVPVVQKQIIAKCNRAGRPVITATQMLESMVSNPRPTRAEASDVANAILDGTDCIMLSGETAQGKYPVEAVETMSRIALRTESSLNYSTILVSKGIVPQRTTTDAISHATVQIAHELGAAAILTSTQSGHTPRMVSKYRSQSFIVAVTPYEKTMRRMMLLWGVIPVLGGNFENSDDMVNRSLQKAVDAGVVSQGDLLVITAGLPIGMTGTTNMIRVHVVGDILCKGIGIGTGTIKGKACIALSRRDIEERLQPGEVLIISGIDEETAAHAAKAAAIVTEEGGLTSPAAVMAISLGIPVIVGAAGITERLQDGVVVTLDIPKGLIFQGEIQSR